MTRIAPDMPPGKAPGTGGQRSPVLRLLAAVEGLLEAASKIIAVFCLVFMFVALLANVVLRYAFSSGIAWAYEIHAVLLPWLVAGGVVIGAARSAHIAITLLPGLLPPPVGRALMVLVQGLVLVISVTVLVSSQPILTASKFQTLSTLGIKQIWGYSSLVYAFGGMAVIAAIDIVRTLMGDHGWDMDPTSASLS